MYGFGQSLTEDKHFHDHAEHEIPVQLYYDGTHAEIGFVAKVTESFVKINDTYYHRKLHRFISRPGY